MTDPGPSHHPAPPAVVARVARVDRSAVDVRHDDGRTTRAGTRTAALHGLELTVGDLVEVVDGEVVAVRPRTSLLARGSAGGDSRVQPLAANVDTVLLCAGLHGPLPLRRLERLLTLAWDSGATPVVVLTKADLCADVPAALREVAPHAPGVDVAVVSAATGDVAALSPYDRAGQVLVLLGASGAGKSTVVNALAGADVMATGDVRRVDGKGRHTTTHRELVELPSGALVVDTPGLRGVGLQGSEEALAQAFRDVEELAVACRFADCGHVSEPGCAVLASVTAGDLAPARVESWRRLQRELAWQARRGDARLQQAEKLKWRAVHREQRARGGRP